MSATDSDALSWALGLAPMPFAWHHSLSETIILDSMKTKFTKCPLCSEPVPRGKLGLHLEAWHPVDLRDRPIPSPSEVLATMERLAPRPPPPQAPVPKKVQAKENKEAKKKKRRIQRFSTIVTGTPRGSSMFGGFKPSVVSVFSGGLPGLGKRR